MKHQQKNPDRISTRDFMDRRTLIKSVIGAAAVAATYRVGLSAAQETTPKPKQGVLKLGSQDGRIPGGSLQEKVAKLEKWGGTGLEVGGGGLAGRVKNIKEAIKGTNVKISAICAGYSGAPISHDPANVIRPSEPSKKSSQQQESSNQQA